MSRSLPRSRRFTRASALCLFALIASGCVATPLPDPPSARASAMTLTSTQPDQLRLSGTSGAIVGGVRRLRVTEPNTAEFGGRVETAVSGAGAFDTLLSGTLADTLYLEAVEPSGDVFIAAVALSGGVVVEVAPVADSDGDRSPDAIDCAPDDPLLIARECPLGTPCTTDAECVRARETCIAGECRPMGCAATETCRNAIDDDCNGVVDDGC